MALADRIKEAHDARDRFHAHLDSKEHRQEDLEGELKDTRRHIEEIRNARAGLEDRHPGWQTEDVEERREIMADTIDELHSRVDWILERLDELDGQQENLRRGLEHERTRIVALRERRRRIREETVGQLSKDFHVAEFDCHDGTPVPQSAIPALTELCQKHLQPLRDSGGSVHINSGYRTRAYNASIGGATMSFHIYDERPYAPAADHTQTTRSPGQVQSYHDAHDVPGMGYYSAFTHIDRGPVRRWNGP